ncbi:hypothetical protein HYDPIDRAFT_54037, partial [Hydnomerulius pinastri MD-312]
TLPPVAQLPRPDATPPPPPPPPVPTTQKTTPAAHQSDSKPLTSAQKASRKISTEQKKAKDAELSNAITKLNEEHTKKIAELAEAHSVGVDKLTKLVNAQTNYKKNRRPTLHNALLFAKRKEVNDPLPEGQKYSMQDIWKMVLDDPKFQDLTKEEEEKYKDDLQAHRDAKKVSVRASNFAAAEDVATTLDHIFNELDGLAMRTGIYASLWVTRGHAFDTHCATWYGTDNAMDFWEDVIKVEPHAVAKQFEMWACNQGQS